MIGAGLPEVVSLERAHPEVYGSRRRCDGVSTRAEVGVPNSDSDGLLSVSTHRSVKETADRLVALITSKGLAVFARIDHAANARQVGMELRPTELLIFGNPRAGTLLMQDRQVAGIDLPVKMLVWQDGDGAVRITYTDVAWLARRHHLGPRSEASVRAIGDGLAEMSAAAASGNDGP
jgi:uncharacterized protein (DUF302 family)